jgi:RNA polymerase sigma factor (sigma-70 family)
MGDLELLEEYVRQRSQDAFAEIVRRHIDMVYSAALRQVHDRHVAEDITQLAFLALARKAHRFKPGVVVAAWLLATTRYEAINAMRARSRRRWHERKAARMADAPQTQPDAAGAEWEQIAPELDEALFSLSQDSRDAVILRYFRDLSMREVAECLGIREEAARQRVSRAVKELRGCLCKRGVATTGAVALASALAANAVHAAPPGLAASVEAGVVATVTAAASQVAVKGVLAMMAQTKIAVAIIGATLLVAVTGTTLLFRRSPASRSGSVGGAASPAKVVFGPGGSRTLHATLPGPSYDTALGIDEENGQVRLIGRGSWVCYRGFNFSPEVDFINLCVAGEASNPNIEIEVRIDDAAGPLIARIFSTVNPAPDIGWRGASVRATSGTPDVYLVLASPGSCNLGWLKLSRSGRDATKLVEASHYDDSFGVWDTPRFITNLHEGYWVLYRGLDFGAGVKSVSIDLAADDRPDTRTIEVRLDNVGGAIIAMVAVEPTGDMNQFRTRTAPILAGRLVTGVHDVYLRTRGGRNIANIASVQFTAGRPDIGANRQPESRSSWKLSDLGGLWTGREPSTQPSSAATRAVGDPQRSRFSTSCAQPV